MHQALTPRPDPQSAIAITKNSFTAALMLSTRETIGGFDLSITQSRNAARNGNQERAISVFSKMLNAIGFTSDGVEQRWPGFPSPESIQHTRPKVPVAIFVQSEH